MRSFVGCCVVVADGMVADGCAGWWFVSEVVAFVMRAWTLQLTWIQAVVISTAQAYLLI